MSEYTPTVWRTGDVITAEKLNKIEEGIAGAEGVTVEALSVTENGTYSEEGKAYSPVTVNVNTAGFVEANVELRNPNGHTLEVHCARIDESERILQTVLPSSSTLITFKTVVSSSGYYSTTLEVYDVTTDDDSSLSVISGNATLSANQLLAMIKGDCVLEIGTLM